MKPDFRDTLLLAITNELDLKINATDHWGIYNGHAFSNSSLFDGHFHFEQSFKPEFLAIEASGHKVVPVFPSGEEWNHSVIFSSRVRKANEANFQRAWNQTKQGGYIFVAGNKSGGIASLRKWASNQTPILDSYSKFHAICFWCRKTDKNLTDCKLAPVSGPVMFSSQKADKGSEILASCFDSRIKGKIADFGSGWGYLSDQALKSSTKIESIDLYEAEWHAIEQSRSLLMSHPNNMFQYHWIDLVSEFKKKPFEWILMNPPFHHGLLGARGAEPAIGKNFIQTAASSLIQGGKLLMVANQNLPYEKILNQAFRKVVLLKSEGGYKVFEATK